MTGEVDEEQENILLITKEEKGFIRPSSRELGLGLRWV